MLMQKELNLEFLPDSYFQSKVGRGGCIFYKNHNEGIYNITENTFTNNSAKYGSILFYTNHKIQNIIEKNTFEGENQAQYGPLLASFPILLDSASMTECILTPDNLTEERRLEGEEEVNGLIGRTLFLKVYSGVVLTNHSLELYDNLNQFVNVTEEFVVILKANMSEC
jgi:hypothetical protein